MTMPSERKLQVDESLDLRGMEGSAAYRSAVERLRQMADNDILELHLDEGEPLRTIPYGLRAEGHDIVISEPAPPGVRLLIRKRAPAT